MRVSKNYLKIRVKGLKIFTLLLQFTHTGFLTLALIQGLRSIY